MAEKPPILSILVRNSGRTPALHIENVIGTLVTLASNKVHDPPNDQFPPGDIVFRSVLQPEGTTRFSGNFKYPMPDSDIQSILSGQKRFYVVGVITYSDVFKAKHFSKFCYQLSEDLTNFFSCPDYDKTDEER